MQEFFHYTKAERVGIISLIVLCVLVWVFPRFLPERAGSGEGDFADLEALAAQWEQAAPEREAAESSPAEIGEVSPFDPNEAPRTTLEALALPANTIRAWLSYTSKGGRWRSLDDMRRFRALQAEDLERIQPYLLFAGRSNDQDAGAQDTAPRALNLHPFDPNTVSAEELENMGVSARVATTWQRFLAGGGRFRQPEDIHKVYGLPTELAEQLIPYASIEDAPAEQTTANDSSRSSFTPVSIDINQSTQEDWQALRGIGPKLSSRIIRFRDKLGGFHSIRQVGETYGLPDSTFQRIRPQLQGSPILRKLDINGATARELAGHPYISNREAEAIVNYRSNHGPYQAAADLESVLALKAETKVKIAPYLSFDD